MTAAVKQQGHDRKDKRLDPSSQVENPFAKLVPDQQIAIVPWFTLECGATLVNAPVAYKTYGRLAPDRSNAIVVCHAFTGSADVEDWWGPLLGSGGNAALDTCRFFVVCMNCLGSPYGSASPVTAIDGNVQNGVYGPTFPPTTIRDDVRLFRLLLDDLGIEQIAAVVGGSMGGMHVLEFAYFGADYVRTIVAIATSAQSSAWNISWGEAQRQSICADRKYNDGYYDFDDPPACGLGAARMSALLTYRSRDSFECRFGRRKRHQKPENECDDLFRRRRALISDEEQHFLAHNEGQVLVAPGDNTNPLEHANGRLATIYSAQSYLRYQSEKFVKRFDANCYIAITHKLDTHDVARDRASNMRAALAMIQQPALIIGIKSDGLFTYREQCELSDMIPNGHLKTIDSPEGHDGFLLENDQINLFLTEFIQRELSHIGPTRAGFQFKESRAKPHHTTGLMLSTWGMGARARCTSK